MQRHQAQHLCIVGLPLLSCKLWSPQCAAASMCSLWPAGSVKRPGLALMCMCCAVRP